MQLFEPIANGQRRNKTISVSELRLMTFNKNDIRA